MTSANPARLFGLYPQKGSLLPGSDADLVLVDPDASYRLQASDLFYKNPHSAYVGCTFQGEVKRTMVRGVTVYHDGDICTAPGFGRLLQPAYGPTVGLNDEEQPQ
jgi:allantoinase